MARGRRKKIFTPKVSPTLTAKEENIARAAVNNKPVVEKEPKQTAKAENIIRSNEKNKPVVAKEPMMLAKEINHRNA